METREILFRAWDTDFLRYVNSSEFNTISEYFAYCERRRGPKLAHSYEGLKPNEQYTGLTDRNGVRIFEGDRVKDSDFAYRVRFGPFQMDEWQIIGFWLEHENPKYSGPLGSDDSKVLEVVGHIHDSSKIWL